MLSCQKVTTLGSDYLDGALPGPARVEVEAHLAGCAGCSAWLQQLRVTTQVLHRLPAPELPLEVRQASLSAFDQWAARGGAAEAAGPRSSATWNMAGPALAAAASAGLLLLMASRLSRAPLDWGIGLGLLAIAALLPLLGRARWSRAPVAAVAATLAGALLGGGAGPLDAREGLECLVVVGLSAAAVAGGYRLVQRRAAAGARSTASWALTGAVAGAAALQLVCGAHGSLLHLVTFHVGGVAAVALLAARFRPARAAPG